MPASVESIFEFVEVWNAAESIVAVAQNYGIKPTSVVVRARRLRSQGLPLKLLPDEDRAGALSRKPQEPKPPAPAKAAKPSKPKSTFNCHVQTMVTYEAFGRLLRGDGALSSGRVREVLERGLEAEALYEATRTVMVAPEPGVVLDAAGRPASIVGPPGPSQDQSPSEVDPESPQVQPPPAFDLFGPTPGAT